jgi:hypothetical protein
MLIFVYRYGGGIHTGPGVLGTLVVLFLAFSPGKRSPKTA